MTKDYRGHEMDYCHRKNGQRVQKIVDNSVPVDGVLIIKYLKCGCCTAGGGNLN